MGAMWGGRGGSRPCPRQKNPLTRVSDLSLKLLPHTPTALLHHLDLQSDRLDRQSIRSTVIGARDLRLCVIARSRKQTQSLVSSPSPRSPNQSSKKTTPTTTMLLARQQAAASGRTITRRPRASPPSTAAPTTTTAPIVVRAPTDDERRAASKWPTWGCGAETFPWTYDEQETCLILEGEVVVTPTDQRRFGPPATAKAGDYAIFPSGMSCTWAVSKPIKKHYRFG